MTYLILMFLSVLMQNKILTFIFLQISATIIVQNGNFECVMLVYLNKTIFNSYFF